VKKSLLICWLLLSFTVSSQGHDSLIWNSSVLLKTVWLDPPPSPLVLFQFSARIVVKEKVQKFDRTVHRHLYSEAQWIRSESFMADSLENRYRPLAQLYFDCYELEARKVQELINMQNNTVPDPDIALFAMQKAQIAMSTVRTLTNEGKDTVQLRQLRHYMDSALSVTPRTDIPAWEYQHVAIGFDVGPGLSVFSGEMADYFHPLAGWSLGAAFRYRRFMADYRILSGRTHSKKEFYLEDFKFSDTSRLQINQGTLSFGICVIDKPKWTVAPYAAFSTFRIINREEPDGSLYRRGPAFANIEGGLLAEWNFLPFYQNNSSLLSWKMLFKGGYSTADYLHVINGGSLKIQVGIGLTLNAIRTIPFNEN